MPAQPSPCLSINRFSLGRDTPGNSAARDFWPLVAISACLTCSRSTANSGSMTPPADGGRVDIAKKIRPDHTAGCQYRGAGDAVLQGAHVAGPVMLDEPCQGLRRHDRRRGLQLHHGAAQQMLHEERDVGAPLA